MDLQTYLSTTGTTQREFAKAIGVTPQMVWQWVNGYRPIAAHRVLPIEAATGGQCSRHELRPDVYPREAA